MEVKKGKGEVKVDYYFEIKIRKNGDNERVHND